ncbi:hypothetical protein [Brevundimonas sp.]|uniref:hypothetical protein n=1 Tax=Brevundimonas sp. TaxID=1871086 RepID=UPI002D6ADC47|nr:hypothetical protein [Brevundimonas sp.]HYC96828.1 hypothetical protein [Brevundimonas sp.]
MLRIFETETGAVIARNIQTGVEHEFLLGWEGVRAFANAMKAGRAQTVESIPAIFLASEEEAEFVLTDLLTTDTVMVGSQMQQAYTALDETLLDIIGEVGAAIEQFLLDLGLVV